MDKPPAAESVDHGRSHPRSSGSARLPTYLILVTISTINLIYFTHCSPSRSPSLRPPPPGPAARPSASSARPPAVHLRRRPAQWDGGMSPLPAYGLPRLQSYDPLTACRSRSLLRLLALRGTLVRTPRGLDDPAAGLPGLCLGFRARPTSALPLPHLSPRLWEISGRVGFLRLRRNRAANSKILRVLWLRLIRPISIGSAAFNSNSASYLSRDGYGLLHLSTTRVPRRSHFSSQGFLIAPFPGGLRPVVLSRAYAQAVSVARSTIRCWCDGSPPLSSAAFVLSPLQVR